MCLKRATHSFMLLPSTSAAISFQRSFAASPNMAAYFASPRRLPICFNESGPNKGLAGYAFKEPLNADVYGTLWGGPI